MKSYTATRTPKHTGPAAWSAILTPQAKPEQLEQNLTADFVVIGGGFAGLSAARRLLQLNKNARVILLEAGRLAEGAAGRNSGFMIDLPHELASDDYAGQSTSKDRQIIRLNRQAIEFAAHVVEDYNINPEWFDRIGKVNGAVSSKGQTQNQNYSSHLKKLSEPHDMLDEKSMHELTGSKHYKSGLYTPGTVMLQPAGYIRGFGEGLRRDAHVFENSPVTAITRKGNDWLIETPVANVSCATVIMANNGQLESFGFVQDRLMHIFLYAVMTPDLDKRSIEKLGGKNRWGVTPSDPMGTTVRRIDTPLGGNRIITRTCASFRPDMQATPADLKRAANVMQQKFEMRFPQLAGLTMEYAWAGQLCVSQNNVSVMKKLDDGIYSACCQNGLGTTRGTLIGIGAAELACGESSEITERFADEPLPRKLPPKPISTLGANMYLRFKEWQAGQE